MRTACLAASLTFALFSVASASPTKPLPTRPHLPAGQSWKPRCSDHSCKSSVLVDASGAIVATALPAGIGATDIQKAYNVDVTLGSGQTVAVVDAYGYTDIESDLAVYRSTYGLPPCTIASGCLTVVNDNGETTPLPAEGSDADAQGWIGETAFDVDMVSAGCPMCKIVVVEAGAPGNAGLDIGQTAAVKLKVGTISDSWGGPEDPTSPGEEGSFNNAGIGTFVSSGDDGYNNGGSLPQYPSTSAFVISVGGTTMTVDTTQARGWGEVAWTDGGSSCSTIIAKPSYQPSQAACAMRAASDLSAAADGGSQGIANYVAKQNGWSQADGTSAASPITAAVFAGAGHGDAVPAFIYKHPDAFNDVVMGINGGCASNLCDAGAGWDGPTGVGTPDQMKLAAIGGVVGSGPDVSFTYPSDGDTVAAGFTVEIMQDPAASYTSIAIDGVTLGAVNADPFELSAPSTLADGAHMITATSFDIDHNSKSVTIDITQGAGSGAGDDNGGGGGGCAASGSSHGMGALLVLGALGFISRRRRNVQGA